MPRTIYTADAELDLRQISQHIANDKLEAALDWLGQIRSTCELLATQPSMGQQIKSRRYGVVRRHSVGSYLIYYWPIQDGVEILLVKHGARDQGKLL